MLEAEKNQTREKPKTLNLKTRAQTKKPENPKDLALKHPTPNHPKPKLLFPSLKQKHLRQAHLHGGCWETFYMIAFCGLVGEIQPLNS